MNTMILLPFAMAAATAAPLQFVVGLGLAEATNRGTGVVLDYAGVENEVARAYAGRG
ncbi:MAG: hypothetical protein IPK13_12410 [Deltaproteobacteria bacterium]|nr:hypothetical protein [Deltaproteobacteria bacterium]